MALARVYWEMRFMIRSFLLLLMAEALKVSPLLILSRGDTVWFCCASRDSRSFQTAGFLQDSRELNEWWNDSRALVVLVDPDQRHLTRTSPDGRVGHTIPCVY